MKIVLTGDSMVNGISEKSLNVNHKAKTVNFPGSTNEKILKKQDDIIKPDDLIEFMLGLIMSLIM